MLVGYIPTTKLEGMTNQAARRRALANLFHFCMQTLLNPIAAYSEGSVPMMSGDRVWRQCHPVFASFIGDYPEQALITCTFSGRCPKCVVPLDQMGKFTRFLLCSDYITYADTSDCLVFFFFNPSHCSPCTI